MKNRAVLKFFLIYFGFTITSNFVHPITPAFLQMIEAPSYIQGVAFSVMSFFTFLTAPFWGKMGDRKPYPKMIAFGYFGYALGQTVFAAARSVPSCWQPVPSAVCSTARCRSMPWPTSSASATRKAAVSTWLTMPCSSRWVPASATLWAAPSAITA